MIFLPALTAFAQDGKEFDVKIMGNSATVFDDNITFAEENKKEDLIIKSGLGIDTVYNGKNNILQMNGTMNYNLFTQNETFNNASQDLLLVLKTGLSKYQQVELKNEFSHTAEPRSFEDAFGRTTGRYGAYRNQFDIKYNQEISKQWNFAGKYSNQAYEVSRNDLPDSLLHRAGFDASYSPASYMNLISGYEFSTRKFDPGKSANTHRTAGEIIYSLTQTLSLDEKLGVDFITSYNDNHYTKPFNKIAINNALNKKTNFNIAFSKESQANAYTQDIFNYWQVSSFLEKQLLEKLMGSVSGYFGQGKYLALNIKDNLQGLGLQLTYEFSKLLQGNLNYTYSNVDSTSLGRDYSKNKILLGITAEF